MECIIFTGLQASGKSSFYLQHFFSTHIRLNLDMLRTRYRERILLQACLQAKQPFVVDNTNPTVADRARYIVPARAVGFHITGYYFLPDLQACLVRNAARTGKAHIPPYAIMATLKKMQPPTLEEGFDQLYKVSLTPEAGFVVEPM